MHVAEPSPPTRPPPIPKKKSFLPAPGWEREVSVSFIFEEGGTRGRTREGGGGEGQSRGGINPFPPHKLAVPFKPATKTEIGQLHSMVIDLFWVFFFFLKGRFAIISLENLQLCVGQWLQWMSGILAVAH